MHKIKIKVNNNLCKVLCLRNNDYSNQQFYQLDIWSACYYADNRLYFWTLG